MSINKLADSLRTHGKSDVISKDYLKRELNTNVTHLEHSKNVRETNNSEPAFKRNRRITFNIGSQNINGIGSSIINHYQNGTITVIKQDILPADKTKLKQVAQSVLKGIESGFRVAEPVFKYHSIQNNISSKNSNGDGSRVMNEGMDNREKSPYDGNQFDIGFQSNNGLFSTIISKAMGNREKFPYDANQFNIGSQNAYGVGSIILNSN